MQIEWRDVPNFKGIQASNTGLIRSIKRGFPYELKRFIDKKGYVRVSITNSEGKTRNKSVHRLVCMAFLPNPNNLPQVNHKDGNKTNNNVENLEWITNRDNALHAIRNGLWKTFQEGARRENEKRKKPVIASKEGEVIKFECVRDAEKYFNSRHISDVCKGKRPHVKGWHFTYREGVMS